METDVITISIVSHEKLENTFKPCLALSGGSINTCCWEGGRGRCSNTGSDTLYIKKMLKVWNIAGLKDVKSVEHSSTFLEKKLDSGMEMATSWIDAWA